MYLLIYLEEGELKHFLSNIDDVLLRFNSCMELGFKASIYKCKLLCGSHETE
jgi:hypothetical protein